MPLDFGGGGLFGQSGTLQTADYRTAGSHQAENLKSITLTAANTWTELHVVPTGKTYYVSAIIIATPASGNISQFIGTGASAAEVVILGMISNNLTGFRMAIPTPLKFSSGTRISVRADNASAHYFTLIGWEE